jgi:hypothetical protein
MGAYRIVVSMSCHADPVPRRPSEAMATRADSLSALQNLGRPLSRTPVAPRHLPRSSPLPGLVDMSLDPLPTRTRKCCKDVDEQSALVRGATWRFDSEKYPIPAPLDLRAVTDVFGEQSRMQGRAPVTYGR